MWRNGPVTSLSYVSIETFAATRLAASMAAAKGTGRWESGKALGLFIDEGGKDKGLAGWRREDDHNQLTKP